MNSPSSTSQRVCEAARRRAAEVLCLSKHNNIRIDRLLCYPAPQFPSPDVASRGHFSLMTVWSTVIQGSFPPISVFLYSLSRKPAPSLGDPFSSVEEYKCLQGLALHLGLRPLVESWPWGLFDFFKKKKKGKKKLWLRYHFYCLFSQVFFLIQCFPVYFFYMCNSIFQSPGLSKHIHAHTCIYESDIKCQ